MKKKPLSELPFVLRRLEAWVRRGLDNTAGPASERAGRRAEKGSPRGSAQDGPIEELHLELTHRCDSRCRMCHHWLLARKSAGPESRELSLDELRRVVEGSRLLDGVRTVVLSGGEPLLRPDAPRIAAMLARRFPKASVGILSNLLDEKRLFAALGELEALGLRPWLGTSLDGLRKNHDRLRGRPGAFDALIGCVRRLRRERPEIALSFCFTLTPWNCADLVAARDLARSLGCEFGAQFVVDHQGLESPVHFRWTPEPLREARAQISRILGELCREGRAMRRILEGREGEDLGLWTRLLYWHYLGVFAGGAAVSDAACASRILPDCMAGSRYAMLDPQGRLFFCPVNKHRTLGGLRERPFDELWNCARARAERRFIASGRCACWLQCTAYPALERVLRAGWISKEPPHDRDEAPLPRLAERCAPVGGGKG